MHKLCLCIIYHINIIIATNITKLAIVATIACVEISPDSSPVEVAAVVEIQTLDTYYPSSIGIAQCLDDGNQP